LAPGPSGQVAWHGASLAPVHDSQGFLCSCSPGQRTDEELDLIFEELLHIKAVAHLSNSVSTHNWLVLQPDPFLLLDGKWGRGGRREEGSFLPLSMAMRKTFV
jgi:hypothetical protein